MVANGRKRKGTIISFTKDDNRIEGDENLLKHATDYYNSTKRYLGRAQGSREHLLIGS
jgi:hypothetical protein